MAFNGSGVFNRLYSWVTDAANALFIDATRMDNEMNGMATGLSTCLTKDGQTTPTANIPLGGFKITGLAAGVAGTDAVNLTQATALIAPAPSAFYNAGNSGAAITIDFPTNGLNQVVTLTNNCTITLSNGTLTSKCRLKLIQDGTGGRAITWAGAGYSASRWVNSTTAPALNTTLSTVEFVEFQWDGSQWYQQHIGPVERRPVYAITALSLINQGCAASSNTTVIFGSEVDPYNEFVAATGIFTAKVAGLYQLTTSVQFNITTGGEVAGLTGGISGNAIQMDTFYSTDYTGKTVSQTGVSTGPLAVGDTVSVILHNLLPAGCILQAALCKFCLVRLGDAT